MTKEQQASQLSRRRFLSGSAALFGAALLPFEAVLRNLAPPDPTLQRPPARPFNAPQNEGFTRAYLTALDRPHIAPLADLFSPLKDNRAIGFIMYNVTAGQLIATIDPEAALPIASAFKAGVAMYFMASIPPDVWNTVPVQFWRATAPNQVPIAYRDAWRTHRNILRDLYQMIVISDNPATGRVLGYIARHFGSTTPLVGFNDWSHNVVGLSHLSALDRWSFGIPAWASERDARYEGRQANVNYSTVRYANLYTARDLGLYYMWFLDHMPETARFICATLLNIVENNRRANIERLAYDVNGMAFSKNGSLGLVDSPNGVVITDGGLIQHANGTLYAVILLSVGGDYRAVPSIFALSGEVLKGTHNQTIQTYQTTVLSAEEEQRLYEEHLHTVYPDPVTLSSYHYNYAFVRYEGIPAYYRPREDSQIRNPVISTSRFGVHLLMQGAILRFIPLDETWAQLVPDNHHDNIQYRLAATVYVKLRDLWPIAPQHFEDIPYFIASDVTPRQKFLVININSNEMVAVERENVVFKTPVALNELATPRGTFVVINKWASRSMQAWAPGVPFTVFFQRDGYALHGSPWQRWHTTVTQSNLGKRTSAGCVNLPNWIVDLGTYRAPLDELVFRWLGGLQSPHEAILEYPRNAYSGLRIFAVDNWAALRNYPRPLEIAQQNISWDRIISNIEYVPLTAPDSFFA